MEALRSACPLWLKRFVWNYKHGAGGIGPAQDDVLALMKEALPAGASLLDLGCGRGNLLFDLRSGGWRGPYTGVDISPSAIATARRIFRADHNAEWVVSALERFQPSTTYDFILLLESIYYVRVDSASELLNRMRKALKPGGRVIVRICDAERHLEYVKLLQLWFPEVTLLIAKAGAQSVAAR